MKQMEKTLIDYRKELKQKWETYKEGEKKGLSRAELQPIEDIIVDIEKAAKLDLYDFDKRWNNRSTQSFAKVTTTTSEPVEKTETYTVARAEEELSPNEIKELERCAIKVLAQRNYLADFIAKEDPQLGKNAAGVGQIINLAITEYNKTHKSTEL